VILRGTGDAPVLAQTYPRELLELIEADSLAAGLERATGEYVAVLDEGRPWLPAKLDELVGALEANPGAGIAYADEALTDDEGRRFADSAARQLGIPPVAGAGALLQVDVVPLAAAVLRTSLAVAALPFPVSGPEADWWLAAHVADASGIVHVPVALGERRLATLPPRDPEQPEVLRATRRTLALQRAMLRSLALERVAVDELIAAWETYITGIASLAALAGTSIEDELRVTAADRTEAAARCEQAFAATTAGDPGAARIWLAARAADPFDGQARTGFEFAQQATAGSGEAPADLEDRIAWAEEHYVQGEIDVAVETLLDIVDAVDDAALRARANGDLAVIAFELGRIGDACDAARAALRDDADDAGALEVLGRCAIAGGDHFQAAHWLRRAAEVAGDDAALWRAVGAEEHAGGRFDAAIAAFERAAAIAPLPLADEDRVRSARHWKAAAERRAPLPEVRDQRRLLLCVDFFYPSVGGLEHIAEGVGHALGDLGWTVEIACRALPGRTELVRKGMVIHEVSGSVDGLDRQRKADLHAIVGRGSYDAILAFSDPAAWPVPGVLSLPPGVRVIVVPCITADSGRGVRRTEVLPGYRASLERADVVVHNSERGFDAWLNRDLGIDGVYVPQAIVEHEPEGSLREELGLRSDLPLLLYVANMHPHKNHAGLLEALVDHPGDWQLVLAGFPSPGVPEESVRVWKLAERDSRVTVTRGMQPRKVAAAMREADLFVCPSHSDAVPLVIQESMCHGLPWIATPGCGAVHDWAGGVILPVRDYGTAIDVLLGDRDLLRELGAAGRSHWEACFNYGVAPRCYDALLRGAPAVPDFPPPADALAVTDRIRTQVYEALIGRRHASASATA
jgi:glycosyltransferase involved in cell wall biosynthesis/tetratricopeptide (TPR) repeat protein